MAASKSGIELKFADVMHKAADALKTSDVDGALRLVQVFFVNNQVELKEYFDRKTLDETKNELQERVEEVKSLLHDAGIADTNKVPDFLQKVTALFLDEYRKREEEMSAVPATSLSETAAK
eukprot:Lankesteria_metandrocarpae@DN4075_c0_g1_i2.p1